MRLHILSDLHLERAPYRIPPDLDFDVLVAAGDISDTPEQAVEFLAGVGKPVVYIAGNHEFYSWDPSFWNIDFHERPHIDFRERLARLHKLAVQTDNIHFLENDEVVLDGVRFLGASLWTDFGSAHRPHVELMQTAQHCLNDYALIGARNFFADDANRQWFEAAAQGIGFELDPSRPFTRFHPILAWSLHCRTRAWLEERLREPFAGKTVVVTHHAPSWKPVIRSGFAKPEAVRRENWTQVPRQANRDRLGIYRLAGYGSRSLLSAVPLLRRKPPCQTPVDLWIHGHLHAAQDLVDRGIRILANPRGYADYSIEEINRNRMKHGMAPVVCEHGYPGDAPGFNPRCVVDLAQLHPFDAFRPVFLATAERLAKMLTELLPLSRECWHRNPVVRKAVREVFEQRMAQYHDTAQQVSKRLTGPHCGSRSGC